MAFNEKNAWICLFGLAMVYVPYFVIALINPAASFPMFFIAIFVLILILSGFHLINALFDSNLRKTGSQPPLDEREIGIETRSAKFAGLVLSVFVTFWSLFALAGLAMLISHALPLEQEPMKQIATLQIPAMPVFLGFQILFAGFVFANISYYGAIIVGYRRGS